MSNPLRRAAAQWWSAQNKGEWAKVHVFPRPGPTLTEFRRCYLGYISSESKEFTRLVTLDFDSSLQLIRVIDRRTRRSKWPLGIGMQTV